MNSAADQSLAAFALHNLTTVAAAKTIQSTKPKNLLSGLFQKVCRNLL